MKANTSSKTMFTKMALKFLGLLVFAALLTVALLPSSAFALTNSNPILPGYHADPYVNFFAGRYWIYPTAEREGTQPGGKFHAFSSTDLNTWIDEGTILDLGPDVSWADTNGWAPSVVYRNNLYYFYYSAGGVGGGQNSHIGVAVGSTPKGPFVDIGAPLVASKTTSPTIEAIDPHVFIDTDGQAYLYYGGSWGTSMGIQRLNSNMTSLSGSLSIVTPSYFTEGAFMSKRNGMYTISYSNGTWYNDTYNVRYATASSPLGPWTYRGQILSSDANHKGPGHHSLLQVPNTDTWYIVYHYWDTAFSARHVAIDVLSYNADGTIRPVSMTGGGTINRWLSSNIAGNYVRHMNGRGRIDPNVTPLADSQFLMVPGLANPSAVSFESINFPNAYLRHRNGEIWLDAYDGSALFKSDATFYKRPGLANSNYVSFESFNFPGSYIRHRNSLLYSESGSGSLFNSDATFIMDGGGVIFYQDINYGGAASLPMGKGDYASLPSSVPNDWMSSLRVPSGWIVEAYEHGSFGGAVCTFTADTSWVGSACNDKMSSFRIR